MRAVIQRVKHAHVTVQDQTTGRIDRGLLVYLGVGADDTTADAEFIADKITNLRIFPDADDHMNLSVKDIEAAVLLISQFTLYGDCRKGRRPDFTAASNPDQASKLYEHTIQRVRACDVEVQTGIFAAKMQVTSQNDGPVTFLLDSKKTF